MRSWFFGRRKKWEPDLVQLKIVIYYDLGVLNAEEVGGLSPNSASDGAQQMKSEGSRRR
jgi:hypothetical protein